MKSASTLALAILLLTAGFSAAQDAPAVPPPVDSVLEAPVDAGPAVVPSDTMGMAAPSYGYGGYYAGGAYGMGTYGAGYGSCCGATPYWTTPYYGAWGHSFRYKSFPKCAMWDVSQSYCKYRTRSPYGPGCGRRRCHQGGCGCEVYASDCCTGDMGKMPVGKDKALPSEPATDSVLPPAPDAVPEPPAPADDASA